ncbi:hypothetical protein Tco_1575387 [Tanacetum coccineum]
MRANGMRLPLDVTGSRNLHYLKNPLTLTGPGFKLLKGTRSSFAELEYDFKECYKALLEKLDWENPKGGDYPFDLSKPLPLITHGKRQRVPFNYSHHNGLTVLQGGNQEEMYILQNISGSHSCQDSRKVTFYDFESMIALRMFTRSLVIQKRVKDLQLGVKSYQKLINVTKPDTTRPYLRKRHSYTLYKDPQGFIYVDKFKRSRLMRSDKLYKFNNGTLTRLLSSLEDITKNIDMEYLPKRTWNTLERKRAHFMIKDINKLLKERRMMRSLEKFVGGRTLRNWTSDVLQRSI